MTLRRSPRPDDWPTVHDRARAALSDQMDGELEGPEAAWLDGHLPICPQCRRVADEYAAQRFELRALRDQQPLPPRDLWARTAAAIELEAAGRPTAGRGLSRRTLVAPSAAFIATALVVAVASGLLTSSQLPVRDGDGGSPFVADATSSTRSSPIAVAVGPTPIPIPRKSVAYVAPDAAGNLKLNVKTVEHVCPKGSTEPCDTSAPVEERAITIRQDTEAVYGSEDDKRLIVVGSSATNDPGTVSVVALSDEPIVPDTPPSDPPPSASPPPPSETPGPTPTPSDATRSPSPSVSASPTPSPTISASPTGSIDVTPPGSDTTLEIARGVALVGQTASYSASGAWFAFTARPIDGSAGPDVYVWRVGTPDARRVTHDGRSAFGSWDGDQLVGSSAVESTDPGDGAAGLVSRPFVLDPSSGARLELPRAGSAWRPVVDPKSGMYAVYWSGTLRTTVGPGYGPETGKLVLGAWAPSKAAAPDATSANGGPAKGRDEITIEAGRVDDWAAGWDPTGTHLAVWIADHQDPAVGRLSLYAVSQFDGSIDLKDPLLEPRLALAGFSISDGELVWAEPSRGGSSDKGTLQLLAWTADGIGTVETYEGSALVIR